MSTWMVMPSNDDVVHKSHKYIDKKLVNGKWRYTYYKAKQKVKSGLGLTQKERLDRANADLSMKKSMQEPRMTNQARQDLVIHDKMRQEYGSIRSTREDDMKRIEYEMGIQDKNNEELKKAQLRQKNAQESFNKTLLGKISNVKESGLKAFNDFIGSFKSKDTIKKENASKQASITKNSTTKYTPSYKTKKAPTTATRGTAYSPTVKTQKKTITNKNGTSQYTPKPSQYLYKNDYGTYSRGHRSEIKEYAPYVYIDADTEKKKKNRNRPNDGKTSYGRNTVKVKSRNKL